MGKEAIKPSKELSELLDSIVLQLNDPRTGVDSPWVLVHYLVRYSLKQFHKLTGRRPRCIHIPKSIEAAVQIDFGRTLDQHEKTCGKLRDRNKDELFGVPVIWDAREFGIE